MRRSGRETRRKVSGSSPRTAFDLDAALDVAEQGAALTSSRNSELSREPMFGWLRSIAPRVWAGRLTWGQARVVLQQACAAHGIHPLRCSTQVIASFARRKFGSTR